MDRGATTTIKDRAMTGWDLTASFNGWSAWTRRGLRARAFNASGAFANDGRAPSPRNNSSTRNSGDMTEQALILRCAHRCRAMFSRAMSRREEDNYAGRRMMASTRDKGGHYGVRALWCMPSTRTSTRRCMSALHLSTHCRGLPSTSRRVVTL